MHKYRYIIPEYLHNQRLDKSLVILSSKTRSQIQKSIKDYQVNVNDKIILNPSSKVKEHDIINITFIEKPQNIEPCNIPLDILYEDEDLLVINKSNNMTVHPGAGTDNTTLVNALLYHSNNLSNIGLDIRPGIVHRLDKNSSGLMVVAKNNETHIALADQIKSRRLIRKYKALIWGVIKPVSGIINLPISRNRLDRKKMSVSRNGKIAITHYKTIEIFQSGLFSLVECKLETGRTHQIRVHMSHIGNSIVGDQKYGNNSRKINKLPEQLIPVVKKMEHQALHSFYISFLHPKRKISIDIESKINGDYNSLINSLRK